LGQGLVIHPLLPNKQQTAPRKQKQQKTKLKQKTKNVKR